MRTRPYNCSTPPATSTHISVFNVKGRVTITAWDKPLVALSGQLGKGGKPLAITGSNDKLTIKVQPKGSSRWFNWNSDYTMEPSTLEIHVHHSASLDVDVLSASLNVDGLSGGGIRINGASSRVRLNLQTPSLDIASVSGDIHLAERVERARLQTVRGDIVAPHLGGNVELQTISGHIQAGGESWQKIKISKVSGAVQPNGSLADNGNLGVDGMSRDAELQLPTCTSSHVHASSFSGVLHSAFGTPNEPAHGPGSSMDRRIGDSRGLTNVETFSGDWRICKTQ